VSVRIAVADDHAIVRAGLAALIEAVDGFELVAEAGDCAGALRACVTATPDVVLLDIQMPGGGIEAARQISRAAPSTAILMLTMFDDDESIARSIAAGALGYVLKGADPEQIVRTIRAVAAGDAVFGSGIARKALGGIVAGPAAPGTAASLPQLSARERHVLELIARGLSNGAIAEKLGLSPHTVGNHISHIFRKLGVATRSEAIVVARESRL
jgi:DNA-binding NarL/FixJ family response regulator